MAFLNYARTHEVSPELINLGLDQNGLIVDGQKTTAGAPVTTAGFFQVGCVIASLVNGDLYRNSGTVASPSWDTI